MIRQLVLAVVFLATLASSAAAQARLADHWATKGECEAATSAPYYRPSIVSNKAIDKANEEILPHPTGGCALMRVPDRITRGFPIPGRAWVRVAKGEQVVFSTVEGDAKGEPLRFAQCDNYIYDFAPFGDGSVSPNPFEHIERTVVPASTQTISQRDIDEAAKRAMLADWELEAAKREKKRLDEEAKRFVREAKRAEQSRYSWFNPQRTSGKVFWGSALAGAGICAWKCPPMAEANARAEIVYR